MQSTKDNKRSVVREILVLSPPSVALIIELIDCTHADVKYTSLHSSRRCNNNAM